jgi:hypothetical protein
MTVFYFCCVTGRAYVSPSAHAPNFSRSLRRIEKIGAIASVVK